MKTRNTLECSSNINIVSQKIVFNFEIHVFMKKTNVRDIIKICNFTDSNEVLRKCVKLFSKVIDVEIVFHFSTHTRSIL